MASNSLLRTLAASPDTGATMPALFIGHGNPMNAIEDTEFSRAWAALARTLPRPKAVLCVSAHWETVGTCVTAMEQPRTIHDFHGFPPALHAQRYPAPGSPDLARMAQAAVRQTPVALDLNWGLDHGAWAVLCRMFPAADVPVVQLSLDQRKPPDQHYALGRELQSLRQKGVLILGSGNIVHNLREMAWQDTAFDWALEFDARMKELILSGDHQSIIQYSRLGPAARLAVPTPEHYLPLFTCWEHRTRRTAYHSSRTK
jgi:4,5-DOPA dioxygenase extradiol